MSQLGRISGQLLKDNLTRNGHDLTFDATDAHPEGLLHLDVNNRKIGIKTLTPATELDVVGTTQTTNIVVTTQSDLGDITLLGDTITSNTGTLNLTNATGDQVNYQTKLVVDNIDINNNVISTNDTDVNLVLDPTGSVEVYADTNVYGNIYATGDIQADGNIIVGNANTDNITFNAEVASDIIPNVNNEFTLGNANYQWKDLWVKNIYADTVNSNDLSIDGINLTLRQGNIYYVSTNGNDTNSGTHQNDPFLTIKHALSVASAGETVYIYPGTYTEIFPMTVPAKVNVRGSGIRSVKIVPTAGSNDKDAFLINGDATIEDITIADFYFNNTNNTGYAFKFASNFIVDKRSPYIRNVSILTKGSTTSGADPRGFLTGDAGRGAYIDGSVANSASKEAAMLFHSATFICPGVDAITCINGARVEWLNSFTYFANKSMNLLSGTSGFAGDGKTRVKITNKTGTWAVGNTLSYYDTDGTTVLASGVIESINGSFYNIDGRVIGFETITDRAGKTISVHGNAKLSTSVKKFGTASLALDGTGDYLTVPTQADFKFDTGAWTVEAWIYNTNQPAANQVIVDLRTASPQVAPTFYINATTNTLRLAVNGSAVIDSVSTIPLNTWTHIAIAKTGTSTKMYIGGSQVGTTYTDTNTYIQGAVTVGARFDGTTAFFGYIDDVKISKGVARYTGSSFTLPTAQLTGDLDTVLLLTLNGSNNSTAIADNGVTLQDLRTSAGGRATVIDFADYSDFGVEVRSIGSAAVYGNYGVYGDGVGVIAYLIGQNLAYIGNGKDTDNDPTTVIQANEIVELNKAKIYYNSVDHKGDFRVGELFYVNQQTGEVSFTNSNVTIGTSLTFDNGLGDVTFLDATKIETGDFRISGNTIQTLTQDFNVSAASNLINLQSNVNISGNLDVTGNVTIGGNITIGDQASDTVSFVAGVNSDIVPTNPSGLPTYNLGTASLQWLHLYASQVSIANVQIDTNVIRTTAANTNLTLQANGTGKIYVPNNNVLLSQNLTVNGTTTVKDTNIGTVGTPATLTHVGALNQTGNLTQTGNINLTGTFTTSGYAQFADILITGDQLKTTIGNNDLTLSAHGTGRVYVPLNDVQINQNLTVNGYIDVNTLNIDTTISSNSFTTGDIVIEDNTIYTTLGNNNLILEAAGTGKIYVPTNNVQLDQNLTVNGTTNLAITNIGIVGTPATVTHIGAVTQTGDLTQTGSTEITGTLTVGSTAQFQDIKINTNVITTTIGNNNLILKANGTGIVIIPDDNVSITQTLTVTGTTSTTTINNTGTITSDTFNTTNVSINGNTITSRTGDSNLILEASGIGKIYVPNNNVSLGKTLTVNGNTALAGTSITGTLTQTGDTTQTGNVIQTGNYTLQGNLTVSNIAQFKDVNITNNVITTTIGNNNLQLSAAGTGRILVPTNNVTIDNNLTVVGTTTTSTINNSGTVSSGTFSTGNISINGNTIQTTTSNSNLQLQAAGTGFIQLEQFDIQENEIRINSGSDMVLTPNGFGIVSVNSTQSIKIPVGSTADRPTSATGMIRFNTSLTRYEGYNGTAWVRLDGIEDADGNTKITAELTPGANDNTIRFYTDGTQVADLNSTRLNVSNLDVGAINVNSNVISTTTTNTNLVLAPNGSGSVRIGNFSFNSNVITNTVNNSITYINQTGNGYVKISNTGGFVIPTGLTEQRPPLFAVGMLRYNTDPGNFRVEVWDGANWVNAGQAAGGGVTVAEATDIGIVSAIIFG